MMDENPVGISNSRHLTPKQEAAFRAARTAVTRDPQATICTVADEAGCSPSTVTSLARRLGYLGWRDMRRRLVQSDPSGRLAGESDAERSELNLVEDLLLRNRDRAVFVHAIGDGSFAADYLRRALVLHGFFCIAYDRWALLAQARQEHAGALFILNESGIALANDARVGHNLGYRVVALTGVEHSPVAHLADILVLIKSNKSKPLAYSPDFYCARAIVFIEMLQARLPYLYDSSIEDDVAFMDLDVQEQPVQLGARR